MTNLKIGVATRLRKIQKKSGIPRSEMAAGIGISTRTLEDLLCGKSLPSARTLKRIHENLDVDINWLLTGKK